MPKRTPAPLTAVADRVRSALPHAAASALGTELPDLVLQVPSDPAHGDFAIAACLPLARPLRKAPKDIAAAVVAAVSPVAGVRRFEVAGPGYINVFLDRPTLVRELVRW